MADTEFIYTSPKYAIKRTNHLHKSEVWLNLNLLFTIDNPLWSIKLTDECLCDYKITASEFTRMYRERNNNTNITFEMIILSLREHENENKNNIGYSSGLHA